MPKRKQDRETPLNMETTLYDCTIDLRIEISNEDHLNLDRIHKTTLTTIAQEFVSRNEDFKDNIEVIYLILKKTLAATKRHWKVFNKNRRVLIKKNRHDAGHITEHSVPEVVYDKIKYSGEVLKDYCYSGPVNIECSVKLFLSPGVYGAKDDYHEHKFPVSIPNIRKKTEDIKEILETWCCIEEAEGEDFGEIWGRIAGGVEEYEDYWESKRLRYATPPRDEEESDEEDYDSEDDEKTRQEKREAKEFFRTLDGLKRKRRRRNDDCCLS